MSSQLIEDYHLQLHIKKEGDIMSAVIGIDVSKNSSVASSFISKKHVFRAPLVFMHTQEGFAKFLSLAHDLEIKATEKPYVILEPTGTHHLALLNLLEQNHFKVVMVNPYLSYRERTAHSLRKVKTDEVDAVHLAQLFYKIEFQPIAFHHSELTQIRYSTRLFSAMSEMLTASKLRAKSIIIIIFPYYPEVFAGSFNRIFNRCLCEYPTSKSVLNTPKEDVREFIAKAYGFDISCKTVGNTTEKLISAARKCPKEIEIYDTQIHSLLFLIKSIQDQQDQLDNLIQYIDETLCHRQDYQIINSIPGLGNILTATILAEIGDISNFDSAKKLNAFAGIEPSVYQSGAFKATRNRISKRGSHYLRHALFIAVKCQIRGSTCPEIRKYYDLKRLQGKPHKVAMIACMNKLVRMIFALLSKKEFYNSDAQL